MIQFNPFQRELSEIDESSLYFLIENSVPESWFVEYKGSLITDPRKIAKSISSFANAEGGWYIIGVESDSKTNVATEIIGVELPENNDIADRLSKIIVSNISPVPEFEIRIINLQSGRVVIVVLVKEGLEPPYITSSGTIHQREHNSNNPVRDRYLIEKMYEKARNYQDSIERYSEIDYAETRGQSDEDQAYLELYLFPSPFNSFQFKRFYEYDFFESIANTFFNGMSYSLVDGETVHETGLGLNFNALYSSFDSLIIRPIQDKAIIYKGTTVELFHNGNLKALLPINTFKLKNPPKKYKDSEVIDYLLNRFCPFEEKTEVMPYPLRGGIGEGKSVNVRRNSEFSDVFQLIDGHEFILVVLYIVNVLKSILNENDYPGRNKIGFRARISNSWRKTIFFDDGKYLNAIKKYNIPATPKIDLEIPEFRSGKYLHIDNEEYGFIRIVETIFEGIGIPRNEKLDYSNIIKTSIRNLKEESL